MSKRIKERLSLLTKLIVILFAFIVASYAWMTNGSKLKMDGLSISTRSVQNLSFSLDGGITWDDETSLNLDENFVFNSEITGDGINLYIPSTRREDGTPVSFREATVNKDYLEFEIMFKSDNDAKLFLASDSFIEPTAGTTEGQLFGEDVVRKSSMGDFSRDLIAGSVRVAFIEEDKEETNMVWAPNPNYELVKGASENSFLLDSTNPQSYNYLNPSDLSQKAVPNIKDNINATYGSNTSGGDPSILHISKEEKTKSVIVRIWVEGNDRETDTSLKGGVFRIYFNFIALSKNENPNLPQVLQNGYTLAGFNELMEYSTDNGNKWISYKDNSNPQFTNHEKVLVRFKETKDNFASMYKEFEY